MIINRALKPYLKQLAGQHPFVVLMGPRQSGKTTLAKNTFPEYTYVTLEDLDQRMKAQLNPQDYFEAVATTAGVIIDSIHKAPRLVSFLQSLRDDGQYRPGSFILISSQNLATGKSPQIASLTLLPLSMSELTSAQITFDIESLLIKGLYPKLYAQVIDTQAWCAQYITSFVEKEIRHLINITDAMAFQYFLTCCAASLGQTVNYASLARQAGISLNTAKAWIAVLEKSYFITLVQPYYRSFHKRTIKSPKLFFNDTALACFLLGITTVEGLQAHPLKDVLFKSFALSEMFKFCYNRTRTPEIYFWHDVLGNEIDVLIEKSYEQVIPINIKGGRTVNESFFKGISEWPRISKQEVPPYIIYAGKENLIQASTGIISCTSITRLLEEVFKERENA